MTATSALYAKTRSQLFISLRLSALVVAALVMATGISLAGIKSPLAFISQGPVRGLALPGENEFLGIPYAAPPVGDLRWQPPHKPAVFTGIFDATQFGNACLQSDGAGGVFGAEDCLSLNVYIPSGRRPPHGYPVMVWIHGGGLTSGAGFFYDPSPIVKGGNVIVVTINYRLGLLGFFAQPALDAEGHLNANYGLMDQQFALRWVRRNIGAFGGNCGNVTIFGESAGGLSVLANVASPTASGLFRRGIQESGGYAQFQDYYDSFSMVTLAVAETVGSGFVPAGITIAAAVGCGTQTAACLRAASVADLVTVTPAGAYPIIDGTILTDTLDGSFKSGSFNRVPVISGTNHDEYRYFVALQYDLSGSPLTDAEYPDAVGAFFSRPSSDPFVQLVLTVYPLSDYPPPAGYSVSAPLALGAVGTDNLFACTSRNGDLALAQYVPTYTYEFNDETAPSIFPPLSFPLGDAHFIEVQYLFDLGAIGIVPDFTPDQQQLSDTMIAYWIQFAKTGNPNASGLPNWPTYNSSAEFESLIAPVPATETDASFDTDHKCSSFWNTF